MHGPTDLVMKGMSWIPGESQRTILSDSKGEVSLAHWHIKGVS